MNNGAPYNNPNQAVFTPWSIPTPTDYRTWNPGPYQPSPNTPSYPDTYRPTQNVVSYPQYTGRK
jgi:hypothetical protein